MASGQVSLTRRFFPEVPEEEEARLVRELARLAALEEAEVERIRARLKEAGAGGG